MWVCVQLYMYCIHALYVCMLSCICVYALYRWVCTLNGRREGSYATDIHSDIPMHVYYVYYIYAIYMCRFNQCPDQARII